MFCYLKEFHDLHRLFEAIKAGDEVHDLSLAVGRSFEHDGPRVRVRVAALGVAHGVNLGDEALQIRYLFHLGPDVADFGQLEQLSDGSLALLNGSRLDQRSDNPMPQCTLTHGRQAHVEPRQQCALRLAADLRHQLQVTDCNSV